MSACCGLHPAIDPQSLTLSLAASQGGRLSRELYIFEALRGHEGLLRPAQGALQHAAAPTGLQQLHELPLLQVLSSFSQLMPHPLDGPARPGISSALPPRRTGKRRAIRRSPAANAGTGGVGRASGCVHHRWQNTLAHSRAFPPLTARSARPQGRMGENIKENFERGDWCARQALPDSRRLCRVF